MNETALAIAFLNGNLSAVVRKCRRDGALAVLVLLEVQRLGRREDGVRFARLLGAVPKKVVRVPKIPVADRPDASPITSLPEATDAPADNGE